MNSDKLSAKAILSQLFQLLDQNATGIFMVTTSDKKALHAILQKGSLTGCSYAQQHGLAALESILSITYGSCRFIEDRMLPVLPHALIDQNPETQKTLDKLRSLLYSTSQPALKLEPEIEELSQYINETTEILETIELVDDWDYFPQSITDINPDPTVDCPDNEPESVWNWFRKTSRKKGLGDTDVIEIQS